MQSNVQSNDPFHVAIIMDGNGRWGERQGLPRNAGHRAGVDALRRVAEAAPELGVTTLTLFAFSSDNWRRPADEVDGLMALMRGYLRFEVAKLVEADIRLTVIGRRDRLTQRMRQEIARVERVTSACQGLHVRLAIDYSGRDAIIQAAARWTSAEGEDALARLITHSPDETVPDVDLLIRTGGEQRLSDFLLWECAYAELWFTDTLWPDFDGVNLGAAVEEFRARDRRFGGLGVASASASRRAAGAFEVSG